MSNEYRTATNLKAVQAIASGARANGLNFLQNLEGYNTAIAKQREEVTRNAELAGLDKKAAETLVAKSMDTFMRQFRKDTDAARVGLWREIDSANQALSYARTELAVPKRAATLHEFNSEARARAETSLQRMGNAALKALAQKAEAEGDKILAAAVIHQNDSIPTNSRIVDSFALADAVFGEECKKVKALCDSVQLTFDSVRALNRSFDSGQPISPTEKVRLGLEHGGNAILPRDKPAEKDGAMSSTDKISAALQRADEYKKKLDAA